MESRLLEIARYQLVKAAKAAGIGRWMRKTERTDAVLCKAVQEMAAGLASC